MKAMILVLAIFAIEPAETGEQTERPTPEQCIEMIEPGQPWPEGC